MALPPRTRKAVNRFRDLSLPEAAAFLNKKEARPLLDLFDSYYGDFDRKGMQKILRSTNDDAIEQVFDDLEHACTTYKPPEKKKVAERKSEPAPPSQKEKGKKPENYFANARHEFGLAGQRLVDLVYSFDPVKIAKSCVAFPTETIEGTLNVLHISKLGRHLAFTNIAAWGSAYMTGTLTAGFTALGLGTAQASLPSIDDSTLTDIDTTAYTETFDESRFAAAQREPLTLDVQPKRALGSDFGNANTALPPGVSKNANSGQYDHASVPGLIQKGGEFYFSLGEETWKVEKDLAQANLLYAKASGLPAWLFFATEAREAGGKGVISASAFNKNSNACGAAQFVPSTLYQYAYQHAADIGYGHAKDLVKRFVKKKDSDGNPYYGYKPASESAEKTLSKMCKDPYFNVGLKSFFMMDNIKSLQSAVRRYAQDPTYTLGNHEIYLAHLSGIGRTKEMFKAHFDGENVTAANFFPKYIREMPANKAILYTDPKHMKHPRSLQQVLNFIADNKMFGRDRVTLQTSIGNARESISAAIKNFRTAGRVEARAETSQPQAVYN